MDRITTTQSNIDFVRDELEHFQAKELDQIGERLLQIARYLDKRCRETERIVRITEHINSGFLLDEVLNLIYVELREVIPFDRLGCALLEEDNTVVRSCWNRHDGREPSLTKDFSASLAGSSLETIVLSGRPRIINDLREHLQKSPASESTDLVIREGIRSSLTCPLIAAGVPVGFLFFSSTKVGTYEHAHIEIYRQIASLVSAIIEKARLASELTEQRARVERHNQAMQRFLAMAAHDLRGPIHQFEWIAEIFENEFEKLNEEERKIFLQIVRSKSAYMSELVQDLIDIVSLNSDRIELNMIDIELKPLLEDILLGHQITAEKKEISIESDGDWRCCLRTDRKRLTQIIENLLSNSVKFSSAGSVVRLRVEPSRSSVRISVIDQGPGIAPEEQHRLFQEFSRSSNRPTGGESSVGLGLAISRRLTEALGGKISFVSEVGKGSTFTVELPTE